MFELYLQSGSDWTIVDHHGKVWSIADAKAAWEKRQVAEYNQAFLRLADHGFDLEACKKSFEASY